MSHYKRYPTYKDSGVEWIGLVPEHWEVKRLRHVAALNPAPEWRELERQQTEYPFLPMEAIGEAGVLDVNGRKPLDECRSGYTYFAEGDVVYAKVTPCFENGKGAVIRGLESGHGFGTTELTVLRATAIDRDYLYALTFADSFRRPGASEMLGSGGLKRVPDEFVRNYRAAIPPLVEQSTIAAALDRETARIDALIAKKTRFIELLKEMRQALITHAVTKGLDPNVKMKDSGVEWIGEVPEHWSSIPIRRVARLESGHTPSRSAPDYWENCTIPWFTLADIWQVRREGLVVVNETSERISELGIANSSARKLPAGTVILSRTASVGFPAIMGCEMATSQDFAAWICSDRLYNRFLYLSLVAMREELGRLTMGSTHKTIYMPDIEQLRCPLPPVSEQQRIVEFVGRQTDRTNALAAKVERSITLLKERRFALITAAVTGKIDLARGDSA